MNKLESFLLSAVLTGLAGCGASSTGVNESARAAAAPVAAVWKDGRLNIDVPVPVITIGFPEKDVAALQAELQPFAVNHQTGDLNQSLPPDVFEVVETQDPAVLLPAFGETITLPVLPIAHYRVTAAPAALEQQFAALLENIRDKDGHLDALAAEDFLAGALPLDPDNPTIVVLHKKTLGAAARGWKIQGPTGFIAPVRLFGERHPLLVLDPSAVADSYASGTTTDPFAQNVYHNPVASSAAAIIAQYVRDATSYRVLQGPVYPPSQAPCHAVTGIFGLRESTSVSESMVRKARETFDAQRVKAGWDHLTGTNVFFDLKILSLPVDDPVLDALARGEFPAFEVMRGYLSVMFEQYHVEHAGCEEYLSVVFAGDVASTPSGVLGIGTYDDSPGQRISMSWVHDIFRLTFDPASPYCFFSCNGKEFNNWWEYLFSHETGHIMGQRHPHDISLADPDLVTSQTGSSNNAFSSVWSSMSYQQDGRMIDFGKIDSNNWRRNRAGFALALAAQNGRENSPEWNAAMDRARHLDWQGVWESLRQN